MKITLFLILFTFLTTSCIDKRASNPESIDLIAIDIKKDIEQINRVVKLRNTEIEIVKGEMDALKVRDSQRVVKINRITAMQKDVVRFKQLKKYFEIKLRKRISYSKLLYEQHYKDKKPWPDQKEFDNYLLGKNNSYLPVKEINKADNSRQLNHKKDISKVLRENGL